MLIIAEDGTINLLNAEACELLAIRDGNSAGRHWKAILEYVDEAAGRILEVAINDVLAGKKSVIHGFLLLRDVPDPATHGRSARWSVTELFGSNASRSCCLKIRGIPWIAASATIDVDLQSYQDAFEQSVEGMFRTTLDGHYIEVNTALAKMYGFATPTDLLSALQDLNTQLYVDRNRRADFVRLLGKEGSVKDFEAEIFRADGTRMWIAEYARTVVDETGRPQYYEGSVVDITARRLAEEKLRESEQRYRLLVEAVNLLPWEADFAMRQFLYVGPQAAAFLGFPVDEWMEEGFWAAHVHDDDRQWVEVVRTESLEKGSCFEIEYRMVHADGRTIWVRDMVSVISLGEERILSGCMLDVTYRRFAGSSAEKSQNLAEEVLGALPVILYVYDWRARRCIYLQGGLQEMLGYSTDALREMDPFFWIALGHPEETFAREQHLHSLAECETNEILTSEFRIRAADGRWVWLRARESRFVPAHAPESPQIIGSASDITVHNLAMEELVNSERLFRNLTETTRVIPFEYDSRSHRFCYVGPQAPALLGHPLSQWYGRDFWTSIVHPEDQLAGLTFADGERGSDHGGSRQTEFRLLKADGRYLWVAQVARRMVDEDKRPRFRGFLLDITEAKQREEEVNRSRSLLRELALRIESAREEERTNISREIHDELGQTLTLFQIELQWLEGRFQKLVPQENAIAIKLVEMKKWAAETLDTVRRLLVRLRPPILDELGLVAAIQWQADEFARRVGIRCECAIEAFTCDDRNLATTVFRVFQETLTNVAKHAGATKVRVRMRRSSTSLTLAVLDNGRGFRPSDPRRKDSFGLLGMRERVEAAGGDFAVTSVPGRGTTVRVRIALAKVE